MTYPDLCAALYAHAGELLDDYGRSSSQGNDRGVLVFFPDDYSDAQDFAGVHYAFYTAEHLARELFQGELPAGLADLLIPFVPGEECPVCIVEPPDTTGRHPIHIHRVTRFHFN